MGGGEERLLSYLHGRTFVLDVGAAVGGGEGERDYFVHCHPVRLKGTNLNICSEYVFINVRGKLNPFRVKRGIGAVEGLEEFS